LSDGRRQIGAFHLVHDIFGLENSDVHRFTAEAIVDTRLRLVKRQSLETAAERDVLVANDLLSMTTSNLQHAEDHMLLLGRKSALERVATFLLEMDRRLTAANIIALETVSRALSNLQHRHILDFLGPSQRQIVLLDREQLASLDLQG
jgi:CRP/FNR family nitrogen fixation transcriptional regulator